ncbi:TonB-dependent hemoglobin/transferrin/lactoferrin family receptor [Silvimonas amylolytica]|uniref:Outer membrane heme receptor n=1 Tax=Silvimonas amylolytica TaxID=449663 RepID=A0ABQ2PNC7_9NEIS|nr:TonB-dependent hemoglobin/transferrin/lactoferrin family receptor [Silvimonas amylolytica]GGP27110.1 outer membrane heme receptor [Silvimonas amylolytica]
MNRTQHTLALSLMACALHSAFAADAPSQSTTTTTKPAAATASGTAALSQVVVTATRTEKTIDELPPSVTTTDRSTLDDDFIRDFTDLGDRAEPGVTMTRQPRYGGTNINIRGLEGNRILMLVDGIRLPDTFSFSGRDTYIGQDMVDFGSLAAIDIVRGPGSTLYGSSALGGIVGLRTLDPSDLLKGGKKLGGRVDADYDSADTSYGARASVAGEMAEGTFWLAQVGGRKGNELENKGDNGSTGANRTEPDPQNTESRNALGKLQHYFEGGHKLGVTGEYRNTTTDTNLLSDISSSVKSSRATDEQTRKRLSLDYDYTAPDNNQWIDAATARVYWQTLESDQHRYQVRTTAADYQRDGQYYENMKGTNGQLVKKFDGAISQEWVVGGEWWQTRTTEFAAGKPASSTINVRTVPITNVTQYGLFAQNEIGFDGGRFSLTPGIRYDNYRQDPEVDSILAAQIAAGTAVAPKDQSDSKFSPKLLATWKAMDNLTVFGQYAQGFRAPSVVEVNGEFTNAAFGYTLVPNPNLKPETSSGYEFGARFGTDHLGGTATVYDNRYRNFIEQVTLQQGDAGWIAGYPAGVFQNINIDRARIYGAEATGHWQFLPNWHSNVSLAYAVGVNETEHTWLDSVAPLKAIVSAGYALEQWGVDGTVTAATAKRHVSTNTLFEAPGYGVVDFTGWYKPVKDLRLSAGVFNLFDHKYWNSQDMQSSNGGPGTLLQANNAAIDRYTQPGRNFRVAASYLF